LYGPADVRSERTGVLDRGEVGVWLETMVKHRETVTGASPWLATLTYCDAVYAQVGLAWLTPGMPGEHVVEALTAVGLTASELRAGTNAAAALDISGVVVGWVEPGPGGANLLHETLAAYAVCEAAMTLRAGTVWAVRGSVPARVRSLLGVRGRTALPRAEVVSVADARAYLTEELFGCETRQTGRYGALRVVGGERGA